MARCGQCGGRCPHYERSPVGPGSRRKSGLPELRRVVVCPSPAGSRRPCGAGPSLRGASRSGTPVAQSRERWRRHHRWHWPGATRTRCPTGESAARLRPDRAGSPASAARWLRRRRTPRRSACGSPRVPSSHLERDGESHPGGRLIAAAEFGQEPDYRQPERLPVVATGGVRLDCPFRRDVRGQLLSGAAYQVGGDVEATGARRHRQLEPGAAAVEQSLSVALDGEPLRITDRGGPGPAEPVVAQRRRDGPVVALEVVVGQVDGRLASDPLVGLRDGAVAVLVAQERAPHRLESTERGVGIGANDRGLSGDVQPQDGTAQSPRRGGLSAGTRADDERGGVSRQNLGELYVGDARHVGVQRRLPPVTI